MSNRTNLTGYNQSRAMFAITRASLRSMLRSPSAVVFVVLFPLVFILAFGFIKTNSLKLDVAFDPSADTTGTLYRKVKSLESLRFHSEATSVQLEDQLHKGRLDAVLFIQKISGGDEKITVRTSKASRERARFVDAAVNNIVQQRNLERLNQLATMRDSAVKNAFSSLPQRFDMFTEEVNAREYKPIDFVLPGQLGFSILSAGIFGTAFVFFSLRQTLVLKRFFATPIRRIYIILGEALSRVIFQLGGALVLILVGRFFFGFTLINGALTLLEMLAFSALGLLVFMGFGFVISGIAKTESTIPPLANIITLPQFLLSGTFFPIDAFPSWLQTISKSLPLTYMNDALRKIAFEGAGIADLLPEIGVILLWGVVVYFFAVRLFRWE